MKRSGKREKGRKPIAGPLVDSEVLDQSVKQPGGNEDHVEQSVSAVDHMEQSVSAVDHMEQSPCEGEAVFEGLCERMLCALNLVQSNLSEVLDVKDELMLHNLPISAQTQLSLCTSRLYRSLADLYTPSTELVRLVRVFGPQWEQKLVILKQLQEEHERLQRLLSLALRRVQISEAQSHRDAPAQRYKNWERLFVRLMRMGPYKPSHEKDHKKSQIANRSVVEL
ncbi:uncharacterized protein O3C94_021739 [Discoglossus pictus]